MTPHNFPLSSPHFSSCNKYRTKYRTVSKQAEVFAVCIKMTHFEGKKTEDEGEKGYFCMVRKQK